MPMEPKGTRPISTLWPDRRSHISEPAPMPMENTASSIVTTWASPPSTSRAKPVKVVRNTEPKNHSQEMPIIDRNTVRLPRACSRFFQVSVTGFQLMRSAGSGAGEDGTKPAATRPATAMAMDTKATAAGPPDPIETSAPPAMVPSRMATKVPISTRPLPPVSSCSRRCWGR